MTSLLSVITEWRGMKFGFGPGTNNGNPALWLFNFPIYVYALCIVTGMVVAIIVAAIYFKKRGYDPYDVTIYALVLIPFGVIGARLYVYIFPWRGHLLDWSTIWDIRDGGLGIYGGVIMGYVSAWVLCKIKKQDFRIITDSILPGVMVAQSLGRWGNFANQEAYGNLITNVYDALPHANGGIFGRFNGYAVWIDNVYGSWFQDINPDVGGWYQATFFYESMCTLVGFLICILILTRSKHYKLGWCTAFYGIYYGIVRLIIEGLRSDSLYLYIGTMQTNIKISQLVSVFAIIMGVYLLSKIYRKQLHALYKKMFKSDYDEMSKSRWILIALSAALLGVGVTMFVLSGMSDFGQVEFIVGFFATVGAVYCAFGVWSLWDRLKLYCPNCHECHVPAEQWQTDRQKYFVAYICWMAISVALLCFGLFSLIKWGVIDGIANGIVLFVVCVAVGAAIFVTRALPAFKALGKASGDKNHTVQATCECGNGYQVKLNPFLLFLFPPKVYLDYGVENLKPWVDPDAVKKKNKKATANGAPEQAVETPADETADESAAPAERSTDGNTDKRE